MSNSFGCHSNFRVLRLTAIFGDSFVTICCKLAADHKSALRSSTFSQCCASCRQRISNLRCFHSELLVSPEIYWSTSSCMGLQMTSLLPTSLIRPFSRPCVVSHRSLLITSYFPLTAQPNYLRLLYQTSRFIRNWWTEPKQSAWS